MYLELDHLKKHFDGREVVQDLSLTLEQGQLLCILGPSGCGKTTTLNMIGGFLEPDSGSVRLDGQDITRIPPEQRPVTTVFQSYGLFPHMTVLQNVVYGLKFRGVKREQARQKGMRYLEMVGLADYASAYIQEISGGQQQRVALARAMVKQPKVFLMDEPLSNLDAKLRIEMRSAIRDVQKQVGITTVYVTHDQEEAMSITDEIVLMKKGIIQQQCAPIDMYLQPVNRFVASFMGNPPIDFFHFPIKDGRLILSESYALPIRTTASGTVLTGIRPEAWEPGSGIRVTIETLEQRGRDVLAGFTLTGAKGKALLSITDRVRTGDTVELSLKRKDLLYLFNEANETRIDAEVAYES